MIPHPGKTKIAVIGLGYVGLPLAVEFGKHYSVRGFDISTDRIAELGEGKDSTLECSPEELAEARHLTFTSDSEALRECNVYIVTVPTPIDASNRPDLTPLLRASETVGRAIAEGDYVIYESTVYPGATEEDCIPVVERLSGLKLNVDFHAGYSPERINPGDKTHRLTMIKKVTSGSTPEAADFVDALYSSIIKAGTHKATSIRIAEAAKVIENTQRDVNIALVNELSLIFNRMGLDTLEVLEAAGSKWNFLPFRPGLVGGHCIGVDPYYLTHKAQQSGYHPEMILAGRRINDNMSGYIVSEVIKLLLLRKLPVNGARVLIMGLSFKENCPDIRNTKVIDIIRQLQSYGCQVDVYDPWPKPEEVKRIHHLDLLSAWEDMQPGTYDAVILAVAHDEIRKAGHERIRGLARPGGIIYDVKCLLPRDSVDGRL
ncbi:MAG: Vi polysaccharide biosynthesis UDP-N-acetylglucosamine C-6 dehydrogenase TviB [Verrucomicrobiaceae bacterium]|nr:MAG: Vi polysaccharide biosynthesis UDP-N-acetylglucosamine C-6 dehydrogenase TviB [Verrucomicrobiaceae bacterium]